MANSPRAGGRELRAMSQTHSRFRTKLWTRAAAVALLASVAPAANAAAACRGSDVTPTGATRVAAAKAICEINAERQRRGLPAVATRARLSRAGRRYANEMIARGFFGHTSPSGTTAIDRVRAAGYFASGSARRSAGEAINWGSGSYASPAAIVRSWMASPGHRRLLLDRRFRHVGIGVAIGSPFPERAGSGVTYVAEFGTGG